MWHIATGHLWFHTSKLCTDSNTGLSLQYSVLRYILSILWSCNILSELETTCLILIHVVWHFKTIWFHDNLLSLETYRTQASDKTVGNLVINTEIDLLQFAVCLRLGVCQEVGAASCTPMFQYLDYQHHTCIHIPTCETLRTNTLNLVKCHEKSVITQAHPTNLANHTQT